MPKMDSQWTMVIYRKILHLMAMEAVYMLLGEHSH